MLNCVLNCVIFYRLVYNKQKGLNNTGFATEIVVTFLYYSIKCLNQQILSLRSTYWSIPPMLSQYPTWGINHM